MQKINIKNILAGLGVCFIISVAGLIGIQTAAQLFNNNEIFEDGLGFSQPNPISSDTECDSDEYGFNEGYAEGLLDRSFDMAQDDKGNFYVVEVDKKRIQKLDKNFKQKNFTFTGVPFVGGNVGNQPTQFNGPKSVSVGADGKIYVVDDGIDESDMAVRVFSATGEYLPPSNKIYDQGWSGNSFDYEITTDSAGNIYIVDASHNFVELKGSSSFIWGRPDDGTGSSKVGEFNYPFDIEVSGNRLYVMDSVNDRIQVFDTKNLSKDPISVWTSLGTNTGSSAKITVDKEGNVYVLSNTKTERFIKKYDKDGNLISTSNFPFADPVNNPLELVFGEDNSIYILDSDFGYGKIHKFNSACGKITIVKDTIPNNSEDFEFTKDFGDEKNFSLSDSGSNLRNSKTFYVFGEKKYNISEIINTNYKLNSIICTDPTSNTTIDLARGLATIDISKGEEVKCVFQNTKKAPLPESPKTIFDID